MRRAWLLLPSVLALATWLALRAASPDLVERVYSRGIYPVVARGVGAVSDLVPFSLAEALGALLLGTALLLLVRGVLRLVKRRSTWRRALGRLLRVILVVAPTAYVLFVLLWGANYGRRPIETKIGYDEGRVTPERFREAFANLARSASASRPDGPPGLGRGDAALPAGTSARVADGVDVAVEALEGSAVRCARRPKTLVLNDAFRWAGIHGITIPFTHEAHHRRDLFACEIPFVAAHERAHLAGYGSEAEANYVAVLACLGAEDPLVAYSGRLALLLHFLGAATREERETVRPLLDEGVREDIRAIDRRRREEASSLHDVTRRVNDAYLKANRVEAGVADYGRVVRLVLGADPAHGLR